MFGLRYGYSLTNTPLERPWVVVGQERWTVALDDDVRFFE
jgi:hypothetical protein